MENAYPALVSGRVTVQRPTGTSFTHAQLGTYDAAAKTIAIATWVSNTAVRFPVALTSVREDDGAVDIPAISDTPLTSDPDGFGGVLAKNTTPRLEYINTSTDRAHRITWPAGNTDKVSFNVVLPSDFDESGGLIVTVRSAMSGTTDSCTIALNTHFNEGDTAVADNVSAVAGTSYANRLAVISAADIPSGPKTVTIEMTPSAHATDALYVTAIELSGVSDRVTALEQDDLAANANTRVHFSLWFRNTSVDF
jgi:hypothetical protein